jgi:hypothetical protein
LWYHVGKDQPIKLLIVRDPSGRQTDDYLFCTDPAVGDAEITERFAARWSIEESIHDAKQQGGFEQVQGWCPRTVLRQAPLALIVQTLVKAWYVRYGAPADAGLRLGFLTNDPATQGGGDLLGHRQARGVGELHGIDLA